MSFNSPPGSAAWLHQDVRSGFEVVFFRSGAGHLIEGRSAAIEAGQPWIVDYEISVDAHWVTRSATVTSHTPAGVEQTILQADGTGTWLVNGEAAPYLDGCLDVDLEASAFTNALPVHRLALVPGQLADAPAAFVRALDGSVERLEQTYTRSDEDAAQQRFAYRAPAFEFGCQLVYDAAGLVLDYPGIATRAG